MKKRTVKNTKNIQNILPMKGILVAIPTIAQLTMIICLSRKKDLREKLISLEEAKINGKCIFRALISLET